MSEETKSGSDASASEAPKKKSPLMFILVGVGAVALIAIAAFGTLVLVGGDAPAESSTEATSSHDSDDSHDNAGDEDHDEASEPTVAHDDLDIREDELDNLLLDIDTAGLLDEVVENLAILDVANDDDALGLESPKMSESDSIAAAEWLATEEVRLAKWESTLNDRESKLSQREKDVSLKLARLEQAEAARIQQLAKMYNDMDPTAVARLMANLDNETVVAVLPRMKQKNAAAVLTLLPPVRGAKLSKMLITLAGEN